MFCFIFVVNLDNDDCCYHPLGRHSTSLGPFGHRPLRLHVFLVGANQCTLGPSGRHPTHPRSFWALPHTPLVLPGNIPCALGPSGQRPMRPYIVFMGADEHTFGPFGRHPTHPWSSRVWPRAPLVVPGAALRQPRDAVAARPRRKGSSGEIWIEKGGKEDSLFPHCWTVFPPFPSVDCCVPFYHEATIE